MRNLAIRCVLTLIAVLAIVPTSSLLAQPAALTATGWARAPDGPHLTDRWVEEWDPVTRRWARVVTGSASEMSADWRTGKIPARTAPLARFGPFLVTSESVATIIDSTDSGSPAQFKQMMAAFPGLRTLSFVDAPGTRNDLANLKLGRMIRSSGLETHIPNGGSARSGAVELFLAGTRRTMEPDALFAVHSWRDSLGREPQDFAEDDPANRIYIDYYIDMGMSETEARGFYAMTNSVPHSRALWFGPDQMRLWIASDSPFEEPIAPQHVKIAYRFDHMLDARVAYGG